MEEFPKPGGDNNLKPVNKPQEASKRRREQIQKEEENLRNAVKYTPLDKSSAYEITPEVKEKRVQSANQTKTRKRQERMVAQEDFRKKIESIVKYKSPNKK